MVNQQVLQGNWNEWKGKLRQKWGQLTNDDVESFSGNVDQLIGLIQRKTGEGRQAIEQYFDELASNGGVAFSQAAEAVRNYAHQASETVQETTKKAADAVRKGADEAQEMIRQRPSESVAICFGAGMVIGLIVGLVLRGK